mmetsp:Transcript_7691/g.12922  ORF Transcript_7691/g.12922 Transcript_7691/m.12922 type:complete len:170 (+) Transcript_7691:245-754(+)
MAGFWLLRDSQDTGLASNPLGLPAYPYEIPLLIQDRRFTLGHQLFYPSDPPTASSPAVSIRHDFVGRVMVTNGKAWPVQSVERRKYRFRIRNGELDPYSVPQFVNPLPNPLAPSNVFTPLTTDTYVVAVKQGYVNILGPGFNSTQISGYANSADPSQSAPTYPGILLRR